MRVGSAIPDRMEEHLDVQLGALDIQNALNGGVVGIGSHQIQLDVLVFKVFVELGEERHLVKQRVRGL